MAITSSTVKQDLHKVGNSFMLSGAAAFTTTSQTGTVPALGLKKVRAAFVAPLQAPATVTRELFVPLGTVSATTTWNIITPPYAGSLVSAKLIVTTAISRDDTNFWSFTLTNSSNADADMVITATDVNKTKLTFLNLLAKTPTDLTVHGTAANLAFTASSGLLFTATKAASGANLVAAGLLLNFNVGDIGEAFYFDEASHSTDSLITVTSGVLTIGRNGPASAATSAGKVGYIAEGY